MTEMQKLAAKLIEKKIPFQVVNQEMFGTPQIYVPNVDNPICDIICNDVSYGHENGLLEVFVRDENEVKGYLNSNEVMDLFIIS